MKKCILIIVIMLLSSALFAQYIDPYELEIGSSYRLSKKTPLMPEYKPANPMQAISKIKYLQAGNVITIVSIKKSGTPWYYVKQKNQRGWVNCIALLGQSLEKISHQPELKESEKHQESRFLTYPQGTKFDKPSKKNNELQKVKTVKKKSFKVRIEALESKVLNLEYEVMSLKTKVANLEDLCRQAGLDTTKGETVLRLKKEGKAKRIQKPLQLNQIVYFDKGQNFKIEQIIDTRNMIVELRTGSRPIHGAMPQSSRFLTTVPVKGYKLITTPVWVHGLDTSKYADNTLVNPPPGQLFKITGTKTYEIPFSGTKTVFVLELVK